MNRPSEIAALPPALRWAVALLTAEAAVAGVAVGALLYLALTTEVASLTAALATPGYVLLIAAALGGVAAALARRKPRARAPAIVLQLLGVVVAYALTSAGLVWLSIPIAVAALAVITLLLTPQVNQALSG